MVYQPVTERRSELVMATQTQTTTTVVGVFQNRHDAQACVNELKRSGFRDEEIGILSRGHDGDEATAGTDTNAGEGAAIGAATGAGVGALWAIGIAAGFLPAIGPAIAGGILASILTSAAGAAAVGGLVGALVGMGVPEEEAEYYESEFKAGRTIVTVKAGTRIVEAREIIRRHNGYDRSEASRFTATDRNVANPNMVKSSSERTTTAAPIHTKAATHQDAACDVPGQKAATGTVQLKKEELHAHKQDNVGEVRVRKDVVTEHKSMDVPVTREEVVIERRPVAGGQTTASSLNPGEEVRIPVKEEQVRVDKTARVVEEVNVGKRKVSGTEHVEGDVRREELRVEKDGKPTVKDTTRTRR
jgi:uncharacterized protein (TIGR02271 family)